MAKSINEFNKLLMERRNSNKTTNNTSTKTSSDFTEFNNKLNKRRFESDFGNWQTKKNNYFSGGVLNDTTERELAAEKDDLLSRYNQNFKQWGYTSDLDISDEFKTFGDYYTERSAQRTFNNFLSSFDSWGKDNNALFSSVQERYKPNVKQATAIQKHIAGLEHLKGVAGYDFDGDGIVNISDAVNVQKSAAGYERYRGDTSTEWEETAKTQGRDLYTRYMALHNEYAKYSPEWEKYGFLNDESAKAMDKLFESDMGSKYNKIAQVAKQENQYWNKFESEDDYYQTLERIDWLENGDLEEEKKKLDYYMVGYNELEEAEKSNVPPEYANAPETYALERQAKIEENKRKYGWFGLLDADNKIKKQIEIVNLLEKEQPFYREKQKQQALVSEIKSRDDFNSISTESNDDEKRKDFMISLHNNVATETEKDRCSSRYDVVSETWIYHDETYKSFARNQNGEVYYELLDEDEKAVAWALYNSKDERYKDYLSSLKDDLQARRGDTIDTDSFLGKVGTVFAYTTSGWKKDMFNLVNMLTQSETQYGSDYLDYALANAKENSSGFGDFLIDAAVNIGNMAPSMAVGLANPFLGKAMFFVDAAATGYQEMIDNGYDAETATRYGIMSGISEVGLQHLLGGISAFGGKLSGNAIKSLTAGMKSGVARWATATGLSMASEFTEEALQEVLNPIIQRIAGMDEEDIQAVDWSQVFYSGLLGAFTAGTMEGPVQAVNTVKEHSAGKEILNTPNAVDEIKAIGRSFAKDSMAYKLTNRLNDNSSPIQVYNAFTEVTTALNDKISQTSKKLKKGVSYNLSEDNYTQRSSADTFMDALYSMMYGQEITASQRGAIEEYSMHNSDINSLVHNVNKYAEVYAGANLSSIITNGEKQSKKDGKLSAKNKELFKKAETALLESYSDLSQIKENIDTDEDFVKVLKEDARYPSDESYKKLVDNYVATSDAYFKAKALEQYRKEITEIAKDTLKTDEQRQEEATSKAKSDAVELKSSDKDVDTLASTNEAVTILGVVREGNRKSLKLKVQTKSGAQQYVNLDDVAYSNDSKRGAFSVLHNLPVPEKSMLPLVKLVDSSSKVAPELQMQSLAEAFSYGEVGATVENVKRFSVAKYLTDAQLRSAVKYGKINAELSTNQAQSKVDTKKKMALEEFRADLEYNKSKGKQGKFKHDFSEAEIKQWKKTDPDKYLNFKTAEGLAQLLSVDIQLIDSNQKEWQHFKENKTDGAYTNGIVYLDINANWRNQENTVFEVLSHELVHYIKEWSPAKFKVLSDFVINEFMANDVKIDELVENELIQMKKLDDYKGMSERELRNIAFEEIVANACERMLTDSKAVEKLADLHKKDKGLFNKIKQFINDFFNKIRSRYAKMNPHSDEAKAVKSIVGMSGKLQKLFEDALLDATENQRIVGTQKNTAVSGVKMHLRSEFATELQGWFNSTTPEERLKSGKRFLVGTTSDVLKSIGVKDYNIYFGGSKIEKILNKHADMTVDTIKQAVNLLDNPILIMESKTVEDSIILFGEVYTETGRPVMISVLLNPKNKNGEILDYAFVTSVYGRNNENLQNLINTSRINYVNENKKRTDKWLKALGLQLPSALTRYGSINSISNAKEKVNIKFHLKSKESAYDEVVQEYKKTHSIESVKKMVSLVDEFAERAMPDSKVRDEKGQLMKVYHGTEAEDFNVFDKARRGQSDVNLWGKGYYFSYDFDFAGMFGGNIRSFFLNITNPFEIYRITSPASEVADKLIAHGEKIDFDYSSMEAYEFVKRFGKQRFTDVLASYGYDGVIVGNFADDYLEYVAFEQNQMKLSDPITYDDSGKVIPLSERFDDTKTDIRYHKKVDSNAKLTDNKNIKNGGAVNGSKNTELLERGNISAVSRSDNYVWKQSENSQRLSKILGVFDGPSRNYKRVKAGVSGWLGTYGEEQKSRGWRPDKSFLGKLSKLSVAKKDTADRIVPKTLRAKYQHTALKNDKGCLLSLYHWTNAKFKVFGKGQLGYHFGTLAAAYNRSKGEQGYYKECYVNIKNPLIINYDPMVWNVFATSHLLERQGVITSEEIEYLENLPGYHKSGVEDKATIELKKILNEKGYDGLIYSNWHEGEFSVLAFYPEQIYTVAENGTVINNYEESETQNGLPKGVIKYHRRTEDAMSDSEALAQHLEENSEAVGEILRRSSDIEMNERTMTRLVSKRLREYGLYGSVLSETSETIALLLEASKHPSVQGKDITADLTDTIKSALESTSYDFNPNKEDYDEVVQILKDHGDARVYLTADQEAHVREQGYDMRWLRNRYFGMLNVVKMSKYSESAGSSEIRLDDVYSALSEQFPNIFPMDDTPSRRAVDSSEYAMDILDKLDYLSRGHSLTIEEAFGADAQEVATRIMSEVVADVVQAKYNSRKNPYVDSVIEKQRRLNNERQKKRIEEERQKKREALQKQAKKFTENNRKVAKKAKERYSKTLLKHSILKKFNELSKLLLKGTKDKNIKLELQKAVAESLSAINMDTVGAENRIKKIDEMIAKTTDKGKLKKLYERRRNVANMGFNAQQRIDALQRAYEEYKDSTDNNAQNIYDEVIAYRIKITKGLVGDTPLIEMSVEQLEAVNDMYTAVLHTIKYSDKVWVKDKQRAIEEVTSLVRSELKLKIKSSHADVIEKSRSFTYSMLKPYYAFENIGSKTFSDLFWDLQKGERAFARDVEDAEKFFANIRSKYNWRKWDHKEIVPFELSSGKTIELTLDQIIFIYNAWKREQYREHIENGGFVFESGQAFRKIKNKGRKSLLEYVHSANDVYRMNAIDVANITSKLTEEQKAYADELEVYLSTTMSEKGNEVSRVLYGIDLYKEKHYTPIESAKGYVIRINAPVGEYTLKNMSASKSTVPNAKNPVVLRSYEDVWLDHVVQMSMYHSLAVPIDSFNKIMNTSNYLKLKQGESPWSLRDTIEAAHGTAAVEYFNKFIRDLNGGVTADKDYTLAGKMFSTSKKVIIAASLSTAIQQPMAVIRAMSEIDPRYFAIPKTSDGNKVNHFETIKKYAEVAILKEIGGFDAGGNRSAKDYINGTHTIMGHVDNGIMYLSQKADELGWSHIWVAVINEQQAKYGVKLRNLTGEAREKFLHKCGDRFNEVVVKTQVYDSVFSRSAIMRSNNEWSKILTSYMGEPITSLNMLYSAVMLSMRGNISPLTASRTVFAVYGSIVAAGAAKALIQAMRDDDEDEAFLERWAYYYTDNVRSESNPLNMMPFVRDVVSLYKGYSVSRPDMDLIEDFVKSTQKIFGDSDTPFEERILELAGSVANLFGIPLKNVVRDGKAIYNLVFDIFDKQVADWDEIKYAMNRGFDPKVKKREHTVEEKRTRIHMLLAAGNTEKVKEMRETYTDKNGVYDDKAFHSAVRTMLREHDPRVTEAAKASVSGDMKEKARLAEEIYNSYSNEFVFKKDVLSAIEAEIKVLQPEEDDNEGKVNTEVAYKQSFYNTDDVNNAFESGYKAGARIFIDDIISAKTDEYMHKGKEKEEAKKDAKSYIRGAMTSYWKSKYQDAYISGNTAEMKRIKGIIEYSGVYSDGSKAVAGWEKELE